MSSDKISSVKESVLAVDMAVQTSDGRKNVTVELNKQELDNLITSLEAANKVRITFSLFQTVGVVRGKEIFYWKLKDIFKLIKLRRYHNCIIEDSVFLLCSESDERTYCFSMCGH